MFTSKFIKHSFHYFSGSLLVMAASFITFPILTRVLSVNEYGLMALIATSVLIAVSLSKLGLNHSAVRLYEEAKSSKNTSISEYYSTLFFTPVLAGLIIGLFFVLFPRAILGVEKEVANLLMFVAILIPVRAGLGLFLSFLRSEQRTKFYNFFNVVSKYWATFISIITVLYLVKSLYGFYMGLILAEIMSFCFAIFILVRARKIYLNNISTDFLKESIKYGLPLFGFEIISSMLSYGDRFLIKYYLDFDALGIYSVGYNCPTYVSDLLIIPLRTAIIPIYIDLWFNEGEESTKLFLSNSLNIFFLLAIPILFGLIAIREEFVIFLASEKYSQSCSIIPYVITGSLIYGTNIFFAAGLFIYKKTYILTLSMVLACILNLGLNIVLIPYFGIVGAAFATLIAYIFIVSINIFFSFRLLAFSVNYRSLLISVFASFIMFLMIGKIELGNLAFDLTGKVVAGAMCYGFFLILLDKSIRSKVITSFIQMRRSHCHQKIN